MKNIVYTENDLLYVVIPAPQYKTLMMKDHADLYINGEEIIVIGMSEAEFYAHIMEIDVPKNQAARIVDIKELPAERLFRMAWKDSWDGMDTNLAKQTISVDMPKARIIHMDNIRVARDEKLKVLDIETLKGVDVQAEKQVLRDLPQAFDLTTAGTPEALKALWPGELK